VLIAWNLYREYGDRAALERHVEAITAYVDHAVETARDAGWIWPRHSWGDWLSPGHMFAPEGAAPTATMMLGCVAGRAADICRALGRTDQAERYADAAQQIAGAYHRAFFDRDSGTYRHDEAGYRQTMNVLPLAFGAVPDEDVDRVVAGLVRDIEQRTDGHLDCGAVGVKHLLPVLSAHGHDDLAVPNPHHIPQHPQRHHRIRRALVLDQHVDERLPPVQPGPHEHIGVPVVQLLVHEAAVHQAQTRQIQPVDQRRRQHRPQFRRRVHGFAEHEPEQRVMRLRGRSP
jgi:hypothetical protein